MQADNDVSSNLTQYLQQTDYICRSFLFGLSFIVQDTARDPSYIDNHLLSYTAQDFLQSTISLPLLIQQGIHNVCRRELRFILEMAIKLCSIQQQQYSSNISSKLDSFKSTLDSSKISVKNQITLEMLTEEKREIFLQDVGRLYGETSNYVHLTTFQILERIRLVDQGYTSGKESPAEVEALNNLIARSLACSLVFLLHSVPSYVAGDLLVNDDGSSPSWIFAQSKYIALIDEYFDYKHERQANLTEIKASRQARISF
jgi:hypothetical protein